MNRLSDRQHDAFDNPAKMACREGNLRVLREAAFLLWQDGERTRLRCDWCELMGATGLLTLELLESQHVLAAGGFVGLDLDAARIDAFRQQRPDLQWVAGDLYERLEAPELANVGILNFDEYGEVGTRSAHADFPLIRGLVQRGLGLFGEFALSWTQDLDAVVRRRPGTWPRPAAPCGHGVRSSARLPAPPRADLSNAAFRRQRAGDRGRLRWRTRCVRAVPRFSARAPHGQSARYSAMKQARAMPAGHGRAPGGQNSATRALRFHGVEFVELAVCAQVDVRMEVRKQSFTPGGRVMELALAGSGGWRGL